MDQLLKVSIHRRHFFLYVTTAYPLLRLLRTMKSVIQKRLISQQIMDSAPYNHLMHQNLLRSSKKDTQYNVI